MTGVEVTFTDGDQSGLRGPDCCTLVIQLVKHNTHSTDPQD